MHDVCNQPLDCEVQVLARLRMAPAAAHPPPDARPARGPANPFERRPAAEEAANAAMQQIGGMLDVLYKPQVGLAHRAHFGAAELPPTRRQFHWWWKPTVGAYLNSIDGYQVAVKVRGSVTHRCSFAKVELVCNVLSVAVSTSTGYEYQPVPVVT